MSDEPLLQKLVDDLVAVLTVTPLGEDRFEGARTPPGGVHGEGRVFGGQVIAQALAAAVATVSEDRPVHSLHGYFLRMGADTRPIEYNVARDLDGGRFSNRRVEARQAKDGEIRPILSLTASFQQLEPGLHHQDPMPDVPGPDELPSDLDQRRADLDRFPEWFRARLAAPRPIEQRTVERLRWIDPATVPPVVHMWWRSAAPIASDDQRVHRAVLAYASDMGMLRTAVLPHGVSWFSDPMQEASLDHAIWFHDDFRADEWLLFVTRSTWAGRARGYITGQMFQDGRLVASVTQEGLIRLLEPKG